MEDFVAEIARFMSLYASDHLTGFVRQEGGWEVLCEHFRYPSKPNNHNRNLTATTRRTQHQRATRQ